MPKVPTIRKLHSEKEGPTMKPASPILTLELRESDTRNGAKATDDWETPDSLFAAYDWEFGFTVDAAAQAHNAKLPGYAKDGLGAPWTGHRVWCNPPYSAIEPWVAQASKREADAAVLLLPVRTGTDWWQKYVRHADEIRYFRRRIRFKSNGRKVGETSSPEDCCLVIWRWAP